VPRDGREVDRETDRGEHGDRDLPEHVARSEAENSLREACLVDCIQIAVREAVDHVAEVEE
jgi:hypothetical protein